MVVVVMLLLLLLLMVMMAFRARFLAQGYIIVRCLVGDPFLDLSLVFFWGN